ncbi:ABC transporter substrate-binding protein [Paracoccus sp. (in: a-proteobacteria)]|uniref:ABC transporter substrate-binding protein n=1 Tax=Paracoccus sp. TaxID=267 RepID=UPI003A837945
MRILRKLLVTSTMLCGAGVANAADLEVMHWWTAGGEAAAVAEFAKAFDATGNHWVDGAIAGSGSTARPIMISRIIGGNPPAAFQFNHGRQADELIEAGLLRDITDVAKAQGWADVVNPPSLLDACTVDGRIYCAPVNIHSWQWLWLSHAAFEKAGVPMPGTWAEYVAAAPALKEAGIIPLALGQQGWQRAGVFNVMMASLIPAETYLAVYQDKDSDTAAGPEIASVFQAAAEARDMSVDSTVQNWNDATNLVITGRAAGQIMGDWAQGEFAMAGQVAGTDYSCLPGLGTNPRLGTGGDAFYFPVLKNADQTAAQDVLAATLLDPKVQVEFNLRKGSLPVRGDIDMSTANDCMRKGLDLLKEGSTLPDPNMLITQDSTTQLNDLFNEFFADPNMTPEAAQARFVEIISDAE